MVKELHVLVECKHIEDFENEFRSKHGRIKELKGERKTLKRKSSVQKETIKDLNQEDKHEDKMKKGKDDLDRIKREVRKLTHDINEEEKRQIEVNMNIKDKQKTI